MAWPRHLLMANLAKFDKNIDMISIFLIENESISVYEVPAHPAYDNPVNNPLYDFEHESHRGNMATPAENIENLTETDYEQISEKENQPSPERENERRIDPSNEKETNQQMHPANGVHLEQPLLMSGMAKILHFICVFTFPLRLNMGGRYGRARIWSAE